MTMGITLLPLLVTVGILIGLTALRAVRTGSLGDACFGQVVWQVTALAMVRGFCATPRDPLEPVEYVVLAPQQTQ